MMRIKYIILSLLVLVTTGVTAVLNVPSSEYPIIQSAIDSAMTNDTVLVQPGEYLENLNFQGKKITVGSLFLTTEDTMYIDQTIINGNNDYLNQGCVVLFVNGEDGDSRLTGFTLTGGYFSGGGGIQCAFNSSPTLAHLNITANTAGNGGGIYCFSYASPAIINVKVHNNAAIYKGGGICCEQYSSPVITQSMIYDNVANEDGGGLYFNDNCFAQISEIQVTANYTSWAGAGIFCGNSSDIELKNSTVRNNETDDQGGGLYCQSSNPYLERVTVTGNSAYEGGGVYFAVQSNPLLMNLTISNNQASEIIGGNYAGGGVFIWNSHVDLVNSILWNDTKPEIYLYADPQDSGSITITHSDVSGGSDSIYADLTAKVNWLEGNFNSDPLFLAPLVDDYRLQDLSPCRETGIQGVTLVYNDNKDTLIVPALAYLDAAPDLGASETSIATMANYDLRHSFGYRLEQNYPNPFNATTNFRFTIPIANRVVIEVYNLIGQKVMTLLDAYLPAGLHQVRVETNDLATGVYLYQIKTGSFVQSKKMILLR
jgi:hypothetical protein